MKTIKLVFAILILIIANKSKAQIEDSTAYKRSTVMFKKIYFSDKKIKNQPVTLLSLSQFLSYNGKTFDNWSILPFTPKNEKGEKIKLVMDLCDLINKNIKYKDERGKLIIDKWWSQGSEVTIEEITQLITPQKNVGHVAGAIVTFNENCRLDIRIKHDEKSRLGFTEFPKGHIAEIVFNQIIPIEGPMSLKFGYKTVTYTYHNRTIVDTSTTLILPTDGKALVYVVRTDDIHEGYTVHCDEEKIGFLKEHDHLLYKNIEPGKHTFKSFYGDIFEIEFQPGKIYYLGLEALGGQWKLKGQFKRLNEQEGKEKVIASKLTKYF